ncbi:uncharacterized protein K452DRAFT_277538 [Aplosporella prunicola CBS 121167]|uniref:Uncharacterized protein n=1 Tax=Aplosporella prunicola CBS 121167 TaxID=1176127 RepID=A0A6A6B540_9PEZI|nr:uncharacterized protein K452DRAFT_277538 [Aplosporella prunicola CBS 121167]KAF2138395.1 hypothetical protein K452DRAFT_277538 [Aplosporella prunicola CBS 121167]
MSSLDEIYQSSSYGIYTGVWTNWSKGRIFGATLTVNRREGALLIAFLALFVSVVGTHFWRVACFALHRVFSTEAAQDALHHQRQIILRNSANGTSGLVNLANILWTWSRKKLVRKPYQRTLPLIGFALLCMVAFGLAGTFSSKISTASGNDVLIKGSNCGILDSEEYLDFATQVAYYFSSMSQYVDSWTKYAEECYMGSSGMQNCDAYTKQRLPTKIYRNASCPFEEDMCKLKFGNIVFDTGYLDSNSDLGINAPANERILFRRVSSCAPLETEGFQDSFQMSGENFNHTRYNFGKAMDGLGTYYNQSTYEHADFTWTKDGKRLVPYNTPETYELFLSTAFVLNGSNFVNRSQFDIIPKLQQKDADIHLLFLSANKVSYTDPINDTWFSAHYPSGVNKNNMTTRLYGADRSGSLLACSVKEQYCNPNLPLASRCSPFGGTYESAALAEGLWKGSKHKIIFNWVSSIITAYSTTILDVAGMLGASSLLARYRSQLWVSGPLPDNQWQLELEHWHAASLLSAQGMMAITANGPSDSRQSPWLRKPNNTIEENLCRSQKIKSLEHTNFSVFGLSFTLALGFVIICLAYTIEPLINWILRRCKRNPDAYKRLEWTTNNTLQLHRLAHEELGIGTWAECAGDVPVTEKGQRLAVLDLDDQNHPRLKAPPPILDLVIGSENSEGGVTPAKENISRSLSAEQSNNTSRTNISADQQKNSEPTTETDEDDNSTKENPSRPSTAEEETNNGSRTDSSPAQGRTSVVSTLTTFDEDA